MTGPFRFTLNGRAVEAAVAPTTRLIEILREHDGLMAAKVACGIGRCGACSVLMDGRPVNACLVMAWQADGRDVTTPEGLDALAVADIVRSALADENAFQCGYCAPGFTIALTDLLQRNPSADETAIRDALAGNICRCTGYHSIIRGALEAARRLRAARDAGAAQDTP